VTTTNEDRGVVIDHRIGATGALTVRLASAGIRLLGTDGDRVVVRTADGRALPDRVVVETHDGRLSIHEKHGIGVSLGRGRGGIELEIGAPRGAVVSVDIASGWLDAQGLSGEQQYRSASGEIGLRDAAGRVDLTSVSGDVGIDLADAAELTLRSISGDVRVGGGRLDLLRVQTTSGDVRVDSPLVGRAGNVIETLSGDVDLVAGAGIRVEARTVSGDLLSDLPHRSEGRMGRRTLVVGDGSIELAFRSVSGDLHLRRDASSIPTPPIPPVAPIPPIPPIPPIDPGVASPDAGWRGSSTTTESALDDERSDGSAGDALDLVVGTDEAAIEADRLTILRQLESGELDVATALERLAALDRTNSPETTGTSDE
jgi:hypothetical protein